jgi:hypothetical protein
VVDVQHVILRGRHRFGIKLAVLASSLDPGRLAAFRNDPRHRYHFL